MTHTVTIADPRDPEAMPVWESGHVTLEDAYRAAHVHVEATQPNDRITRDHAPGVYAVTATAGPNPHAARVATIVITPDDDTDANPASFDH